MPRQMPENQISGVVNRRVVVRVLPEEPFLWVLILLSALVPKTDNSFVLGFESYLGLR